MTQSLSRYQRVYIFASGVTQCTFSIAFGMTLKTRLYISRSSSIDSPTATLIGTSRCGHRHLTTFLACLPDAGNNRKSKEAQVGSNCGHRIRPRRSRSGDQEWRHGRGGYVLEQYQRIGTCCHDDPVVGAQLHSLLPVGVRSKVGNLPGTLATSGSHSPRRKTIHGELCLIMG
jgi:hypothetical protein